MTRLPVVWDVEGPCPARTTTYEVSPIETAWRTLPHVWEAEEPIGPGDPYIVCRYCGGRKP